MTRRQSLAARLGQGCPLASPGLPLGAYQSILVGRSHFQEGVHLCRDSHPRAQQGVLDTEIQALGKSTALTWTRRMRLGVGC